MNKSKSNMNGGDVIGSGGFGCVFQPSLQCKTHNKKDENKYTEKKITKLMMKEHADEEYDIIVDFQTRLRNIKNYGDYFLLQNITKCDELKKLTKSDLKGYSNRCKPLIKNNITKHNINHSLEKLSAITMPYGGIELNNFFIENINNYPKMKDIFLKIAHLVKYGVEPMNKRHVYHGDIKAANILVDKENVRIIDWGLAFHHEKNDKHIHDDATGRPFQFNVPPTCVILNDKFTKKYDEYLTKNPKPSIKEVTTFVTYYLNYWNEYRGTGSLNIMNYIYEGVLDKNNITIEQSEYVGDDIKMYITNVVYTYTKNGKFELEKYYHDVYLKNIDLWGIVISCIMVLVMLFENKHSLNAVEHMLLYDISELYLYIIEHDIKPMKVKSIYKYLKQISELYSSFDDINIVNATTVKGIKMKSSQSNIINKKNRRVTRKHIKSSKNKLRSSSSKNYTRKIGVKYF